MKSNILQVKNLTVELDNEKIINNLSFQVKKGEFLTILGPNGSGKTVLLRTLLGLIPKYTGEIIWQDNVKIGYLPQGLTHLKVKNLPLSVEEFLSLKKLKHNKIRKSLDFDGRWKSLDFDEKVELLKLVGIDNQNILKKKIGNLSGGQFQRMLMAWALSGNPDILLFDEPTVGVDVRGEKTIYRLLRKLQKEQNLTIILITHDLNVVFKYSTDVLCVSKDNICHATPKEVLFPEKLKEIYGMPIKFYKHNH